MNGKRTRVGSEVNEREANKGAYRLLKLQWIDRDLCQGCGIVLGGLGEQLLRYVVGCVEGREREDGARTGCPCVHVLDLLLEGREDRSVVLGAFRCLA